jgi:hypothetical protein
MSEKQLHEAIECSEKMLLDAEAGNWENVFDIEAQRSVLLEKLFSSNNKENNVHDMDDKIRKIIAINKKLEAITLKSRDSTRNDLASIRKGRHAVDSYQQNAFQ